MKSQMAHSFAQIPRAEIERSTFNRSHSHKTVIDTGKVIPVFLDEALPGDTFKMNMTAFGRMVTPKLPIMDNMRMKVYFFSIARLS